MDLIEKYDRIAAVNLYLRNSWYHQAMQQFIDEGEIGELAILRICHMTPGLAPGEGHEYCLLYTSKEPYLIFHYYSNHRGRYHLQNFPNPQQKLRCV